MARPRAWLDVRGRAPRGDAGPRELKAFVPGRTLLSDDSHPRPPGGPWRRGLEPGTLLGPVPECPWAGTVIPLSSFTHS